MRFSASKIQLYMTCRKKFYLKYVEEIEEEESDALAFGKAFHECVPKPLEEIKDKNIREMVEALNANDLYSKMKPKIKEFEYKNHSELDGKNFVTILDAHGDDFTIDFKSAKSVWKEGKEKNELQPAIYTKSELVRTGRMKDFYFFVVTKPEDRVLKSGVKHIPPKVQVIKVKNPMRNWNMIKKVTDEMEREFDFEPNAYKDCKQNCYLCQYKEFNCEAWF